MAKPIDGNWVETITDETVKKTFEFLNQYPKIEGFAASDEDGVYEADEYRTKYCENLDEVINQTLKWVNSVIGNSTKVWLRVFPQLQELDNKYRIRVRIAYKKDGVKPNKEMLLERYAIGLGANEALDAICQNEIDKYNTGIVPCKNDEHQKIFAECCFLAVPPLSPWICKDCGIKGVNKQDSSK
jgi:hypothetical protein